MNLSGIKRAVDFAVSHFLALADEWVFVLYDGFNSEMHEPKRTYHANLSAIRRVPDFCVLHLFTSSW